MDNLREIKKASLLENESFTIMLCSEDKKTVAEGGTDSNIIWDLDFGGYDCASYENYKVEVLSAGHNGFVRAPQIYLYMICDNLSDNGTFLKKKLAPSQCVLAVLPVVNLGDNYIQPTGSTGIIFNIKNVRIRKRISIKFLRPDLADTVDGTDINVAGVTRWFVTLKLTPMIN
jgi:hypothetical protein